MGGDSARSRGEPTRGEWRQWSKTRYSRKCVHCRRRWPGSPAQRWAATWLALAQRMSTEVGQGVLREATTRSSGGSVTIYAIAARAVLVIIGDEGLDTTRLHRESQPALDAIRTLIVEDPPVLLLSDSDSALGVTRPDDGPLNTSPCTQQSIIWAIRGATACFLLLSTWSG